MNKPLHSALLLATLPGLFLLAACGGSDGPTIRVALDQQFSQKLLERYGEELGIEITQLHDTEASKTVGHVSTIRSEKDAPRCDVFWNNELGQTVRLAQEGLLEPYVSPSAADIPARWKDPNGLWTGFAARARVLIVNTDLQPDEKDWPRSYLDLVDPKWKGQCAVAKPLTGTTLTHFAALRLLLGKRKLDEFIDAMADNDVQFLKSNGATMRAVREGRLRWAFTDTDDYHSCKEKGFPVACVYPDQGEDQIGTMLIPNSIAIIKGGPHTEAAKKLVDRILKADTEAMLAAGASAQIPVREGVAAPADESVLTLGKFRMMEWDAEAVGRTLASSYNHFSKKFQPNK